MLGYRDLSTLVTLTGWDNEKIREFDEQQSTSYAAIVNDMNLMLNAVVSEINNDPLWGMLASYTTNATVRYRVGVTSGFSRFTEYSSPDPQMAETEGHMLPLIPYDLGLGWTWDYLRQSVQDDIDADLMNAVTDTRDLIRQSFLGRLLKRGDETGEINGLGSGLSTGFATAAANTGVDFVPVNFGGNSFDSDHEHYVATAGGALTNADFADMKDELIEHGHDGPYQTLVSRFDEDNIRGLSDFVPVSDLLVVDGDNVSRSTLNRDLQMNAGYYIGSIKDSAVWVLPGMPQYYAFQWKSYGMNSPKNPLRIRLPKGQNALNITAMTDPRAGSGAFPIQNLVLFTEFGVGVGDRTNGTTRYFNSATWADGVAA